jgi:hypothetical protein
MSAPLLGGFLNDNVAPRAIWAGGFIIGVISVSGLAMLARKSRQAAVLRTTSTD